MKRCDDCEQPKSECPKCRARSQMLADLAFDRLREDGYRSFEQQHIVEEMDEAYLQIGRC